MAEEDQGQERTEQATPKRREEAREKGQVAVSREVASAIVQSRLARPASEAGGGEAHARRISVVKELMRRWDLREVPLDTILEKAKAEGQINSVGMPDDWANWRGSWAMK